jgi:hypothetical protein
MGEEGRSAAEEGAMKGEENTMDRFRFHNPQELAKVISFEQWGEAALKCPVCGCNETHVQSAYTRKGSDPGEAIPAYSGTEQKGTTPSRRSALSVLVEGESCGHRFEVIFQQHKGDTFIEVEILKGRDPDPKNRAQ